MIPPSYKPKKKFMELAIAEAKRAGDRGDYPIGAVITRLVGQARSGDCQRRQPGENFGLEHQARRARNAEICVERLWALPARLRSLLDARAVRDVRRSRRVVTNWRSGVWRFAGRYRRVWEQARNRILQVASLSGPVPADFREGQSPHSCFWRISAARMPETFQLQACEAVAVVFEYRFGRRLQVCHRFPARFTGMPSFKSSLQV